MHKLIPIVLLTLFAGCGSVPKSEPPKGNCKVDQSSIHHVETCGFGGGWAGVISDAGQTLIQIAMPQPSPSPKPKRSKHHDDGDTQ